MSDASLVPFDSIMDSLTLQNGVHTGHVTPD
jgi:hypothetical protein